MDFLDRIRHDKPRKKNLLIQMVAFSLYLFMSPKGIAQEKLNIPNGEVTVSDHLDWEMVKRKHYFNYTEQEIKNYFDRPLTYTYDFTGYAKELVKSPPPPGIHPRVWFYEEDLPELRKKLSNTVYGKASMDGIRNYLNKKITGPGAVYMGAYEKLVAGTEDDPKQMSNLEFSSGIVYELFRCVIDNDGTNGKRACAALATYSVYAKREVDRLIEKMDAKNPGELYDYQAVKNITMSGLFGLGYDWGYNWMTQAQRDAIRATIVRTSKNFTFIGSEALPCYPPGTSNWIPMHTPLIYLCCSIEGEEGSDPSSYQRCVSAYKNYLGEGFFPEGEMFESMGKNFLCAANMVPLANRGQQLLALKKIRMQIGYYYLHALDVWGGSKISFFDSLGGTGNDINASDVMIIKRMFPNDPKVDYIYRNAVGEDYRFFKGEVHVGHPLHVGFGLIRAIFCVPYDESKSYAQAKVDAIKGEGFTYYSKYTGNMITVSSWDDKAVQLHSLTRQVAGGHVYADRSHFSIYGLGRYFSIYKPLRQVDEHYLPKHRNVILIDGKGCGFVGAKGVAFVDRPEATFACTDVKPAYDYTTAGNERYPKNGFAPPMAINDFRLFKGEKPWMDIPYGELPNWQTSNKKSELWLNNLPVEKAFRTTGLVRGKHPYALVVDDIKKDGSEHAYQYGMLLADDLEKKSSDRTDNGNKGFTNDAIFAAKGDKRSLLVRVLNANGTDNTKPSADLEPYVLENPTMKAYPMNRMVINSQSVDPDFKVLYFPHNDGEKLPITVWNKSKTVLSVQWDDQKDEISFGKTDKGRSTLIIKRGGGVIVEVR